MDRIRALIRLATVSVLTIGSYLLLLVIAPLRAFAPALRQRLRNGIFRSWGRSMAYTMGMRTTVEGTAPRGGFFLVSNHLSYMDIMLLGGHVDAAFVAKADLRAWPLLGAAFRAADTIFVDRARRRDIMRVMKQIGESLDQGLGVVLFPEGTSGRGDEVLPFKAPILELAVRSGRPVSHATIHYRTGAGDPKAGEAVCWWGDAPFGPHLWRLLRMRRFRATLRFGAETVAAQDRKTLAGDLRDAISEHFEPIAQADTCHRPR